MDELHDQTVNLLSFQQMPTTVFGTQVAFNITSGYGADAKPTLASVEERILRHFHTIVNNEVGAPSILLLQVPVFHAHTFSMYVEMENAAALGDAEAALAGEHVQIMRGDDRPSNVNVAGSPLIQVAVRKDVARDNGLWIWVAADNLRISASLAVEAAEEMATMRPRGKVQ
jgi:aspartate-semialdehyde dehydrogenase